MRVVALSEADYAAWEENQLEGAQIPEDELAAEGMDTFRTACSQCHLVEGPGGNEEEFEAAGGVALVSGAAPSLTHFASRGVFAGAIFDLWVDTDGNGEVDVDEIGGTLNRSDLIAWLRNPPGQKPMAADEGRGMPNLELTDEQITALIAYLETLE
jgi:cytochrome c oxidase subunit 2